MSKPPQPLCVDCRFHSVYFSYHICKRWPESRQTYRDVVTGKETVTERSFSCRQQRRRFTRAQSDHCGPEGKYFKPKPPARPARPRR